MKKQSKPSNLHVIRRGLDVPLSGGCGHRIVDGPLVEEVAVMPDDWVDVAARPVVEVGQHVRIGDVLFEDRRNPGVRFVSPGAGVVSAVHRGDRRAVLSIVIRLDGTGDSVDFVNWRARDIEAWSGGEIRALMIESGMWTVLRERPFGTIPRVDAAPCPIFVTAIDTNPLAPDPSLAIAERTAEFKAGLAALVALAGGLPVYACIGAGPGIHGATDVTGVETHRFAGPHPAGLVGTHMHFISPASVEHPRWHIGWQDVIALGALIMTGRLFIERIVGVAGPSVTEPIVWRTRQGAALGPLLMGRLAHGENRIVSGSVLYGRGVSDVPQAFLGRFHNQVTAVREDRERRFLGWLGVGLKKFSVLPLYLSRFLGIRNFDITTSTHGSVRAVMPFGLMERVMPLDIMATQLCRALMAQDAEWAAELGAVELDEEDMALCTLVCPGKNDYGPALRSVLDTIRKEG